MSTIVNESPPRKPMAGILRNVTSNWAALLVNTLLSFVVAPIVVNSLGSVYYGVWTLVMQFTGYLWLFDFGVRESVIKYVAQYHASGDRDKLTSTIQTAISVYTVVSAVGLVFVGILALALPFIFNLPPEAARTAQLTTFITGLTVAYSFLANVFVGVLMGLQRFYLVSRLGILFSLFRAAAILTLLSWGFGIVALASLQLVISLASRGISYRLCAVHLPTVRFRPIRPQRAEVMKLLTYGKWVLVSNIGDKIVFATDAVVIGIFLPISALTPYAIAGTLVGHLRAFITAMASIFNPLTSSLEAQQGNYSVATILQTGAKAAMLLGLPVCIGFVMLGERFITLWMGVEFGPTAGIVLLLLALGQIIGLPYHTISGVMYGLGRHRLVALLRIVEGAANLGLSVALVGTYGLSGVALGTTIPHVVVVGWVLPLTLPRLFPISLREYFLSIYVRPLLASIPFCSATWLIATVVRPAHLPGFIGWVGISVLTYVVPVWFVALSPGEREHVVAAVRRRLGRRARLRGLAAAE